MLDALLLAERVLGAGEVRLAQCGPPLVVASDARVDDNAPASLVVLSPPDKIYREFEL